MKHKAIITLGLLASSLLMSPNELTARSGQDRIRIITQRDIDRASGNLVLNNSGEYRLACDLRGTLTIGHDNLCLDLACHKIDGQGAAAAISATGRKNISISNGSVTNPGSLGIQLTSCTGANVNNVQMYESNAALALIECNCSQVSYIKAYENVNTSSAVILADSCDTVAFSHIDACNNIKTLTDAPPLGTVDPAIGIFTVFNSTNTKLNEVSTNTNRQTNDVSRFAPLALLFNNGVTVTNCQSSFNKKTVADTQGFIPFHIRFNFDPFGAGNIVVDGFQINSNTLDTTSAFFRPLYILDAPHVILKNMQINDNSVRLLGALPGLSCDMTFMTFFTLAIGQNDNVIDQCQMVGNTVWDGGNNPIESTISGVVFNGFADFPGFECRSSITRCQINDNSMVTAHNPSSFLTAIIPFSCRDITISDCSIDGNTVGEGVGGNIAIDSFAAPAEPFTTFNRNINIRRTTTNNNTSSTGFAVGLYLTGFPDGVLTSTSTHCAIENCQSNDNVGATVGYGVLLENATGCLITNTQADGNSHAGFFAGQLFNPIPPTLNTDCAIINCTATNNEINGFEIQAASNFLLQGNRALGNGVSGAGSGFVDNTSPRTNAYIGNYASNNASRDYALTSGAIPLQQYNLLTGTYIAIGGGDDRLTAQSNITTKPS